MPTPDVSVVIETFNHEKYIAEAIESVFAQQTILRLELLISEDCSTDRTREIVREIQREHPDRIRLLLSERNLFDASVFTRAWRAAEGAYVAMLEGDDYWTDPLKLQKQVDFLEQHPDVFVRGHAVRAIDEQGRVVVDSLFDIREDRYLRPEALVLYQSIPTLSWVFRNNRVLPAAKGIEDVFNLDTIILAYFANFGAGYVSREVMGTYRIHSGGMSFPFGSCQGIDHRNRTFARIPAVLRTDLKSIGYYGFLYHSIIEDYSWSRKIRNIPMAAAMMIVWIRFRPLRFFAGKIMRRVMRLPRALASVLSHMRNS